MNLLKKLALRIAGVPSQYLLTSGQWVWPGENSDTYINSGYKDVPNLYGIISLITQKSSIVPFEVYKTKDERKSIRYKSMLRMAKTPKDYARCMAVKAQAFEKVEGSKVEKLLLKPNSYLSTREMFEQLDGYRLLTGNSYIWAWTPRVGVNASVPVELHVPPSTMVTIETGDSPMEAEVYRLNFLADPVPREAMGHMRNWNPLASTDPLTNGLYGMSPLLSCRRLLGRYRSADVAQGSMFHNMSPAGILSAEGNNVTEPQAVAVRDRFKQLYGHGAKSAGEIVITSASMKWQRIGFSPVDMSIIEAKEEMLGELCNVYHVPIGLFTRVNSTENNMIESRKMLITDAIIPLVEERKALINSWLVPKFGEDVHVEFDYSIFSEITEELGELIKAGKDMWWTTINEKRELTNYDRDPNPDFDKIYIPSNLLPLDQVNGVPDPTEPSDV